MANVLNMAQINAIQVLVDRGWSYRRIIVRIYSQAFQQIAVHATVDPGRFSTKSGHIAPEKINRVEKGVSSLLGDAALIGTESALWAQTMIKRRGIQGIRVLQGFLSLSRKHEPEEIERACSLALSHEVFRLKPLRRILKNQSSNSGHQLAFLETHELIRDINVYGEIARKSLVETSRCSKDDNKEEREDE